MPSSGVLRRVAGLLVVLTLTAGCSGGEAAEGPGAPVTSGARPSVSSQTPSSAVLQQTANRLAQSIREADRSAFDHLTSDLDPGFAATAEMLFTNLTALAPSDFTITLTGRTTELSTARRQLLGAEAAAMPATVSWRMPGERTSADHLLTLTFVPARNGDYQLAGTTDAAKSEQSARQPLWWFEPVQVARQDAVSVITSQAVDPEPWLARARRASRAVAAQRGSDEQGLVLVVPGSGTSVERVLGGTVDDQIGALTWADGSETAKAPCRIAINPAGVKDVGEQGLDFLLAHEAVHAETHSPSSPSPQWVIEGYADLIASRSYPDAQDQAAEDFLADVRRHGAPQQLPTDEAFDGGAKDLAEAYAQAGFAFRYLEDTHSMATATRFYDELGSRYGGDLDRAVPALLDQSLDEFIRGWRADLERRAG